MIKSIAKERSVANSLRKDIERLGGIFEKVEWHKTGWPDRFCGAPDGTIWVVETKRPKGGVLSARQLLVHRELRAKNIKVRIVFDQETKGIFMDEFKRHL